MLRNYIKIALRNLSYSSVVNIGGLALGLAISVYLFIYINQQLSFDAFHKEASRTYRILNDFQHSTGIMYNKEIGTRHAMKMDQELSFIEKSTNISSESKVIVEVGDQSFYESNFYKADSNFFKIFDFQLIEGSKESALLQRDKVIISSRLSKKYFGEQSPLGEMLTISNTEFEIEGVIGNTGRTSHLNIEILGVNDYQAENNNLWLTKYFLSTESSKSSMERQINALFDDDTDEPYSFTIQGLTDIHLHTNPELTDFSSNADVDFLFVLGSVAILILITVSFNYTNLSLAKYLRRVKEIGMRKIQGASRRQVILQLLLETFTIVFMSLIVSGVILEFILPYLNDWIQYEVVLKYNSLEVITTFSLVLIGVTLAAGGYPAYYITSFSPRTTLTKDALKQNSRISLIKVLVAVQFVISTILLTATVIMQKQMRYLNEKDLGLTAQGVLAVNTENKIDKRQYDNLKNQLLALPEIKSIAAGSMPDRTFSLPVKNVEGDMFNINVTYILDDYIDLLDIEILAGRNFDLDNPADGQSRAILNEEALKLLGLPNGGIGERFSFNELDMNTFMMKERSVEVIGIAKDYHYRSLKDKIEPLFLVISESKGLRDQIGVRFSSNNTAGLLERISSVWKGLETQTPFSYSFLTDDYDEFNRSENRLASGFSYIAYLAILLSALGLFGLSNLEAKGSYKTISIKKVLGASKLLLLRQYLSSYLLLSLCAGLVGISVAWWFIQEWLQNFSYRFEVNMLTIVMPILIILLTAGLSVFYNLQSAASVNPVENLRKEN